MRFLLALLLAALCLACPAADPAPVPDLQGQVVKVADGDTITVLDDAQAQHKIRLAGIDAPEKGQDHGELSRQALAALVAGKRVRVQVQGKDKYGRTIGRVFVGSPEVDVNLAQVRAGWAWHYLQFAPKAADLARGETEARAARAGLWALPTPTPPWEWRKKAKAAQ